MAQLTVEGDALVYKLSSFRERSLNVSWFSKPISIPLAAVRSATVELQAYESLWGGRESGMTPMLPPPPGGTRPAFRTHSPRGRRVREEYAQQPLWLVRRTQRVADTRRRAQGAFLNPGGAV